MLPLIYHVRLDQVIGVTLSRESLWDHLCDLAEEWAINLEGREPDDNLWDDYSATITTDADGFVITLDPSA